MKKILLFLLCLFLIIPNVQASTSSAYEYVLMDMDSGRVLASKNMHSPRLIASITKIMTALVALENANVEDIVKVDDSISKSYGSGIYISIGEEIRLLDLLYGLMLRSGNDAAIMIATDVAGSEENFVKLMNEKAEYLGMKNTIFYNSSGLDTETIGNKSTAYDMALLTSYAMKNEVYREIVKTKKYIAKTNLKTYVWHNKNKLLSYDYITGGKTGYTERAKRTLVSTASKDNMNLVVVTINDSDDWNTHKSLYTSAFDMYKSVRVLNKNHFQVLKDTYYDKLYIENDAYLTLKKRESKSLVSHIKLTKNKKYKTGDKVGECHIYLGNTLVHIEPIYAKRINKKQSIIEKWFK